MARSNAWDVLWSPCNPNKFIRYNTNDVSSDICLFQLYKDEDSIPSTINRNQVVKFADSVYVCPVSVYSEFSSVKSVAWCPRKDLSDNCVLAVGSSNGRVSVMNVGSEHLVNSGLLLNQEFLPKAERACHDTAWNEQEPNLLAVGLDKTRYDNSLLVWDVEAKPSVSQSPGLESRAYGKKPVFEHGSSEPTVSISWLPHMQRTLLSGGSKWLRLFDIRVPNPKVIATTKAVYGICVDPHDPNRIASFAEGPQGAVLVWDIRNYEKPLVTINQTKPVSKILWCPTRNHLLSVLQKDSMAVKYYDLQYTTGGALQYSSNMDEDNDSIPVERNAQLPKTEKYNISSYSWHPSIENTILTISAKGHLYYLKIFERITMSWSPSLDLVWGCGKHMFMCSKTEKVTENDDISSIMKRRAIMGYGEPSVMKDENRLREVLNDNFLVKLWKWLKLKGRKLKDHESRKLRKFYGVKAIIKGGLNNLDPSSSQKQKGIEKPNKGGRFTRSYIDEKNPGEYVFAKRYTSDDRKLAMFLCDWDLTDDALNQRLSTLSMEGEPERAAAMALFNNRLDLTIQILSNATPDTRKSNGPVNQTDPSLPVVAMALSGYSDKQSLWAANCKSLSSKLKSPYLRAIFAFLTTDDEDFTNVLRETGMDLGDRIAFACCFLSDAKLTNYVENVTTSLITSGSLEGLLLTGLTSDGLDLLENFITKTSDIQTAILIVLNTKVSEVFKDMRVSNWIENYRDILDKWRLWHERAQFDSLVQSTDCSRKIPQQISVTCTYCSKPVSNNQMSSGGMRVPRFPHGANSRGKAMSCPGCRQPLPRCSVCQINMGSLSSHLPRTGTKPKLDSIVNSFQSWFTWCQLCRHGGHASHLMEWFGEHIKCPVTGCSCPCNAHDSVAMVTPKQTGPLDSSEERR